MLVNSNLPSEQRTTEEEDDFRGLFRLVMVAAVAGTLTLG